MLFSSISFIFYFLPVLFLFYFVMPNKYKNMVLLVASLFFYFCGEPRYTFLLLLSIMVDFVNGLLIEKFRGSKIAKMALLSSVFINLSMLIFFKYTDFFITNTNELLNTNISLLSLGLPIGLSFYTFQTMSYTIDVYRGEAVVQKNPFNFAMYVSLFPQLIAGPIVRYKTIAEEIETRTHSFDNFAYGMKRFVIGLSKKVFIANAMGELSTFCSSSSQSTLLIYWLGAIAFTLQIYFDFSGYSDMAIGLGRIFGFHFPENFNYPLVSKSITEFWGRWHISLGTWFKEYLYIPLGGNRVSKLKWYRNIFIVWFCTGFWHGASWNFILWGLYFATILVVEKHALKRLLEKTPFLVQHIYVLCLVILSFVIFNSNNIADGWYYLKGMFGFLDIPLYNLESIYYLKSYTTIIIIAMIGATPLMKIMSNKIMNNKQLSKAINVLEPMGYMLLLLIASGYLVDSSFNPFLYFRF